MLAAMKTLDSLLLQARTGRMRLNVVIDHAEQLKAVGSAADAATLYKVWAACTESPAKFVVFFNWGVLLAEQGELDAAETAYRHAFKLNPRLYQAKINAGLVLERKKNDAAALELWSEVAAADIDPRSDEFQFVTIALNHAGRLQEAKKEYAAAEQALATSLQLNPRQPDAIQHWVHLRQKQCKWPVYEPLAGLSVNALMAATSPLAMLAMEDDPALQWLAAQSFVQRKYALAESQLARRGPRGHAHVRIGYLSGDLCTHAVGLLMTELIEAHDRDRFRIYAFDFSPEDGTQHRARLKAAFDQMISIHALDDRAAAQTILAHEIDILIDLHGLSAGARPGILALRPAPLQGTYLGYIGTTALPWMDFVVTDPYTLPAVLTPYYSERALYVEGALIPLHQEAVNACRFSRGDAGLPDGAVVLACFNNVYKLNAGMFACWMRILKRSGNCVLWLLDDNPWATAQLRAQAGAQGIDPQRLIFAKRSTHAEYREKLTLADVYLDTFPYNAGSTARDVLDAGLPMVTLSGRTAVSRMAGSMLYAAGLDELITTRAEDYEERVVNLASRPDHIRALKNTIAQRALEWHAAPATLIRSLERELLSLFAVTGQAPPAAPR